MSPRKTYILKLYVAGNTPNSMRALKTLRNILDTEFQGVYALKVIDVTAIDVRDGEHAEVLVFDLA